MKRYIPIFLSIWFTSLSYSVFSQQTSILEGIVFEIDGESPLPGANVYWESERQGGVVTDIDGRFSIRIPENFPDRLVVSFIGYKESIRMITDKDSEKTLKFYLKPEEFALDEVIISDRRSDQNVRSLEMGKSVVPIETLKNIPALFGEVDLLRGLQLLPGVQTAGEGTTGLFVRGGSADQNLVQLDGAPVYNPSHFFGFFSIFNPDALNSVDFYKGNIPANFGGRASSVIDVGMKEGNFQTAKGEGGIGTISSRLTVEGPLMSDKSSFLISGRRTYADVFLKLAPDENIRNNSLYFYDLSGKFAFKLSDKDKLTLSSYYGSDYLGLSDLFGFGWNNFISSVDWKRNISDNSFFDLNAYHSKYNYAVNFDDESTGFLWDNVLTETGVKAQWAVLNSDMSQLTWGFHSQLYQFAPIRIIPSEGSAIDPLITNPNNGMQNNLFVSYAKEFGEKVSIETGLRWSAYHQIGSGVQYIYEGGIPNPNAPIVDSVRYNSLEPIKFYQGLEPRFSIRYMLKEDLSVKAAANRNYQYIQVATNSSAGLPVDRWIPAGTYVPPIRADQVSLGIYKNINNNQWELSAEGYYKDFKNVVDLRQGANVLFSDNVESDLLIGNGYAYGLEVLLRKNLGKTSGWLSYTYSRTWRIIEGISENRPYNPRFDRPHDVTLVLNHQFNPQWSANMTFVYTTGQAVTFPIGSYEVDTQRLPLYSNLRNTDRFPDYHRMDASVTYKNQDKGRKWRGSWNFSIYNLYGRKNPFSYQFTDIINDDINFQASSDQDVFSRRPGVVMTYLFTFLPAITYNFQF